MANEWLRYNNQGATRSLPLNPRLNESLASFLPSMGLTMEVFSGGQPSAAEGGARVGSVRHDHGGAADVFFYKDGRKLDWANPDDAPIFQDIVRRGKEAGITGFGAGPGYMQPGSMHIGFGSPGVWGAGGSGKNAPDWLRTAYGSSAPTQTAAVTDGPKGQEAYIANPRAQPSAPVIGSMAPQIAGPSPSVPAFVQQLAAGGGREPQNDSPSSYLSKIFGAMGSQQQTQDAPPPPANFQQNPQQANALLSLVQALKGRVI